jgi:hypothetical protein
MRQALITIELYLGEAVEVIDRKFGNGYAAQHPELVGAFIQAASSDYAARKVGDAIEALDTSPRLQPIRTINAGLPNPNSGAALAAAGGPHGWPTAIGALPAPALTADLLLDKDRLLTALWPL